MGRPSVVGGRPLPFGVEMTPGQVAYEKWKKLTATLRLWEHLHPAWKERWEQVAEAVMSRDWNR